MSSGANILSVLTQEGGPAADLALLAALRGADAATGRAIVEVLLVRNQKAGLQGLIQAFHELDDSLCQQILGKMDELFAVLRVASQSRNEQVRVNVLEAIRRGCAYRAAYLADAELHDHSARVREAAAQTLHTLADQLLRTSPVLDDDLDHLPPGELQARMAALESYAEDRRQVVSAVESGLQSFHLHLHPAVVEAAMWFVDDLGARFWSLLSTPASRAAHVALSLVAGSANPRLVPFCMGALSYAEFRPHVVKVLSSCTAPTFLAEWLRESWRLVQPRIARSMAALKKLECLENRAVELLHVPSDAQRHLPRWINALGIPSGDKLGFLKDVQRRGERSARRPAALVLISRRDEGAVTLLRRLARDNQCDLSAVARLELARRRPLEYPPRELVSMPAAAPDLPEAPRDAQSISTFERYWALFDHLSQQERRTAGARVIARDSSARSLLARRLIDDDPVHRARAIQMVALLGLATEFPDHLYRLSYDSQPEVRGTAVKALGQLSSAASRRVLRNALNDEDPRVQANAVEAVEASDPEFAATNLLAKLASPDNRVRANAVKALLRLGVRQAAETLLLMLQDRSRAQRISALWLVDHLGLVTLATRVLTIADADEDVQVRDRAKALADRLLKQPLELETNRDPKLEVVPSAP